MKLDVEYTSKFIELIFSINHSDMKKLKSISTYFIDEVYLKMMIALHNQKFTTSHYLARQIGHHKDPLAFRLSELMKRGLVTLISQNNEDYPIYFKFWKQLNSHTHSHPVFYTLSDVASTLLARHKTLILNNSELPEFENMSRIGRQFEKFYEKESEVQQAEQSRIEELEVHTLATCVQCEKRILKADVEARKFGEFNGEIYCKDCFSENMLNNYFKENAKRLREEGVKDPYKRTWKPKTK